MGDEVSTQDPVERLLLDPALVYAIAGDHDVTTPDGYKAAEADLRKLAEDVFAEEASGFNPSGIPIVSDESHETTNESATSLSHVSSPVQRVASSSTSSYAAESSGSGTSLASLNQESEERQVARLQSMFGDLKEHQIRFAVKRAKGDFGASLDDLLSIQALKAEGGLVKGVDGFFQDESTPRKKGKKGKKSNGLRLETNLGHSTTAESRLTPKHQEDIADLAALLNLDLDTTTDFFRRSGNSQGGAAILFLDQCISQGIQAQNEDDKRRAAELSQKYRNVSDKYMVTIIQVTDAASQSADELAALLSKYLSKHTQNRKLDINYRLKPLPQEDLIDSWTTVSSPKSRGGVSGSTTPVSPSPYTLNEALQRSQFHTEAQRSAWESASAMRRKGASNPLFRQGAVVYTDRAREQGAYAQAATSSAADALVASNSTGDSIDLHGVSVSDGVRIARRDVRVWWDGLGEFRSKKARENGFTIITGLGRHSSSGVSQMRQAVARALIQDGWNYSVMTGSFLVKGRK